MKNRTLNQNRHTKWTMTNRAWNAMSALQGFRELPFISIATSALVGIGMYAKIVGSVEPLAWKWLTFWLSGRCLTESGQRSQAEHGSSQIMRVVLLYPVCHTHAYGFHLTLADQLKLSIDIVFLLITISYQG